MAKRASRIVPFNKHRDRLPSVFIRPISASMALRRCRLAISLGLNPRLVPLIRTRVAFNSVAAIAAVDYA